MNDNNRPKAQDEVVLDFVDSLYESIQDDSATMEKILDSAGVDLNDSVAKQMVFIRELTSQKRLASTIAQRRRKDRKLIASLRSLTSRWESRVVIPAIAFAATMTSRWEFRVVIPAIAFAATMMFLIPKDEHTITRRGEQQTMLLVDGSRVRLNSESELIVKRGFGEKHRTVILQGEGFFKIAKSDHPFIVDLDFAGVEVIGTEFNIKAQNDQIEVAVNEGVVEISTRVGTKDSTIILTKDLKTHFAKGEFPNTAEVIRFQQYASWIYDRMNFYEASLQSVVREIEQRFDVVIRLADTVDANRSITGLFEADEIDNLLTAICLSIQKNYYEVEDDVYKIY